MRKQDHERAYKVAYDSGKECGERERQHYAAPSQSILLDLEGCKDRYVYAFALGYVSAFPHYTHCSICRRYHPSDDRHPCE